jgi:ferredoxin
MEGPGPNSGTPKFMGLILASADGIALDLAAAHIMGYNYASIPIIQQAVKRNLLTPDGLDQISFVLGTPEEFRDDSFLRISQEAQRGLARTALGFIKNRLVKPIPAAKPIFDKEKCIGCGQCAEICPADALVMQGIEHEYVSADYNKCIRCYCCHEICPVDAITIEQGRRR